MKWFLGVLAALVAVWAIFQVSFGYFRSEELAKAEGRLSLYQNSISAEVERYAHLTHILARDSVVVETIMGADTGALNLRFEDFAQRAGLDAIYLIAQNGETIAASNHRTDRSFIGQNYAFRPYFQAALAGDQGRFYAIGATTGLPGYFIADAVRGPDGSALGVVAIKIDFSALEQSWSAPGEHVVLADAAGVILMASSPRWRYKTLAPLGREVLQRIKETRQFPSQDLDQLDWRALGGGRANLEGVQRLYLVANIEPAGWGLHYFSSEDWAISRAWLVSVLAACVGAAIFIGLQVQRSRRVDAALRRSEQEEVKLRRANEMLALEIDDRRTAERRLARTKDELERASRLAALGQLSASVTHELGQPIAAMRNHLVAAEIGGTGPSPLTQKLEGLVGRMESITKQLKFFARQDGEPFEQVDLHGALAGALGLLQANIETTGVAVRGPDNSAPATLRGSRLRIEQVITNLLRNAIDACEEEEAPEITLAIGQDAQQVWFAVSDNGHGIGQATLADLQEPFVSSRESGRGMGLGLAISAGIVKDHAGTMQAENLPAGGARFRVEFPRSDASEG
ncbi:sensor histidine kinase [Amylibacter marinus]